MSDGRFAEQLERARTILAGVVAFVAVLMLIGGVACKSTRWTDLENGTSMSWTDGVKPWAIWSFLGALVILGLFYLGLRNEWWFLFGGVSALLFFRAATMAVDYKHQYKAADWAATYDHQDIAPGLSLVPIVSVVGVICAVLLTVISACLRSRDRKTADSVVTA